MNTNRLLVLAGVGLGGFLLYRYFTRGALPDQVKSAPAGTYIITADSIRGNTPNTKGDYWALVDGEWTPRFTGVNWKTGEPLGSPQ